MWTVIAVKSGGLGIADRRFTVYAPSIGMSPAMCDNWGCRRASALHRLQLDGQGGWLRLASEVELGVPGELLGGCLLHVFPCSAKLPGQPVLKAGASKMSVRTGYDGTEGAPNALMLAVARYAERRADLIGSYLRSSDLRPTGEIRLPAAALLELAAVVELGVWERRGIRCHIDSDLPFYREAADTLVVRCSKGPSEFRGPNAAPLSELVLRVWIENFAWDGPRHLQTDVVVGNVDEDEFIDLLADFVWSNRRELAQLIRHKEQE